MSRVVVVTGASSGIGEATARAFARVGASVVLAARREERLRRIGDELTAQGREALVLPCDVTKKKDLRALADEVERRHGRCDVLVNNAGVPAGGPFADLTMKQIDEVTATNYLAVLWCTKLFLPMLLRSRGHIVNVASLAGRYAIPGASVYTATKHAVVALSEALYHELEPHGVAVTAVNPGLVATERFTQEDLLRDPRTRRAVMTPERVAGVIVGVVRKRKGPEVSVPRWLAAFQAVRVLAPRLYRAGVARMAEARGRRAGPESD